MLTRPDAKLPPAPPRSAEGRAFWRVLPKHRLVGISGILALRTAITLHLTVLPLAMLAAGLFALLVGAISLRTRGVYFIMITLAFAQMAYYLVISARAWGGDDGLPLVSRMTLGGFSLGSDAALYYAALACLALVILFLGRMADARFGRVIQAIRENETRMEALGYPVFRYRLSCFILGGALAGLAGALLANLTGLASPNLLVWTQSGTLLMMVIIGGVGYLYGGLVGALILLCLEEVLAGITLHWHIGLGLLLLAIVLFAPKGVAALFGKQHG
jgi:branched-chain amino acid transport system permease protein